MRNIACKLRPAGKNGDSGSTGKSTKKVKNATKILKRGEKRLGKCRKKIHMEDQKGLGLNVEYLVLVRLTLEITFVGILNFPRYIQLGREGGRLVFLMTCTSWKEQTFYHSIVSEAVCHL